MRAFAVFEHYISIIRIQLRFQPGIAIHYGRISTIGICHGVQSSAQALRDLLGVQPHDFSYLCAGITHLDWFLQVYYRNINNPDANWVDAHPDLRKKVMDDPSLVGSEKIRWDLFKATGYFMTQSLGSVSELVPYYRKKKTILREFKGAAEGFNSLEDAEDLKNYEKFEAEINQNVED